MRTQYEVEERSRSDDRSRGVFRSFLVWIALVFLRLVQLSLIEPHWDSFADLLSRAISGNPGLTATVMAAAVISLGRAAAWWKERDLLSYGFAEVTFGSAVSWQVAFTLIGTPNPVQYLALGSALYVIARGFTNMREADKKAAPGQGVVWEKRFKRLLNWLLPP